MRDLAGQPRPAAAGGDDAWDELAEHSEASLRAYLSLEEASAYPAIAALVGERIIGAFAANHDTLAAAAGSLCASPAVSPEIAEDLLPVVEDHLRLEETVLFPLALGALANDSPPGPSTAGKGSP